MRASLRLLLATVLGCLLTAVALVSPAEARTERVHVPYVTASTPHTLTVTWPKVRGASRYVVAVGSTPARATTSSRTHRSHGRRASLKIRGLHSSRRYCFTVKAVKGGTGGRRSAPVCSFTLRRTVKSTSGTVSVATFNVCAFAINCKRWTKRRENAIVQRIVDADADVVAVQEVTTRADKLARRLAPHGYVRYAAPEPKIDEAIYYRSSAAEMAVATRPEQQCEVVPYSGADDTRTWRFPRHLDEASGRWFTYQASGWISEEPLCQQEPLPVEQEGRISSPTGATGVWAALRLRSNGKTYAFVSAHLSHGPTKADGRLRGRETRQLVRSTRRAVDGLPVVYMGDFNSYRGGPSNDPPRKELAKRGWVDTFDGSETYSQPYVSSFNGWQSSVQTLKYWGGHIDRIFIPRSMGSTSWRVVAKTKKRRYLGTQASDHNLVRTTILLP